MLRIKRLKESFDRFLVKYLKHKIVEGLLFVCVVVSLFTSIFYFITHVIITTSLSSITLFFFIISISVYRLNIPEWKVHLLLTSNISAKACISKAPGAKLLAIVDFLFRPKTVELTFNPLVADWQSEYFEALNQGHTIKAHWIMVRYRFHFTRTFIMALGLSKVLSFFKQVSK